MTHYTLNCIWLTNQGVRKPNQRYKSVAEDADKWQLHCSVEVSMSDPMFPNRPWSDGFDRRQAIACHDQGLVLCSRGWPQSTRGRHFT